MFQNLYPGLNPAPYQHSTNKKLLWTSTTGYKPQLIPQYRAIVGEKGEKQERFSLGPTAWKVGRQWPGGCVSLCDLSPSPVGCTVGTQRDNKHKGGKAIHQEPARRSFVVTERSAVRTKEYGIFRSSFNKSTARNQMIM